MKEITYFYLNGCPYCKEADGYIARLTAAHPEYKDIKITKVEETKQKEYADSFDYYFVPCFYIGKEKLHEGAATQDDIEKVLKKAL